MTLSKRPTWLKGRGYLHLTPKINVYARAEEILSKVQNPSFVARHAFFPLIHSVIKERKFKKHPDNANIRGHTHFHKGKHKQTAKKRPLHYSTHFDALIFGYYAEYLLEIYEKKLRCRKGLADCVTAYRKIALDEDEKDTGKSTINFANEAFKEIEKRAADDCVVLMFDIKSFFSELNHDLLKAAWCNLLNVDRLPNDHFNVFNASTKFSYILRDELRLKHSVKGRRSGFDEKKLASIRKNKGLECFFESNEDLRNAIKSKTIKVYKKQFVKDKIQVGIPQGLPISAVLANLYLYDFDLQVLDNIVDKLGGYYRRYSDDILIICKSNDALRIKDFINSEIQKSKVSISEEKTETYFFRNFPVSLNKSKIVSIQVLNDRCKIGKPLTYLGFEFYGDKILIKSANLAKFYRRMIYSVKRKASRAIAIINNKSDTNPAIYRACLKRLYSRLKLNSVKEYNTRKRLVLREDGYYYFKFKTTQKKYRSNYFSYVSRSSKLMNEESINKQIRGHRNIFNQAISKHLKR